MKLGVNIDHIATLRNARGEGEPCVLECAKIAENCDISAITIHLREDRRHIKDEDVYTLKRELICPINLEMAVNSEIQKVALDVVPKNVCLVPEKRQEVTTEGGLDVCSQKNIKDFIKSLKDKGIIVSLFIEPDFKQIKASFEAGADFIELHTGKYSRCFGGEFEEEEFQRLKKAALYAQELGLKVNAGHGLNYKNVKRMHEIKDLYELNIGHTIISRAITVGLKNAVIEMKNLLI